MDTPTRLYKLGITTEEDALRRFDEELHNQRSRLAIPLSRDYTVRLLWSRWMQKGLAREAEKWFADQYPKNFYCEVQYNGIRECREWTVADSYAFQQLLVDKYPKTTEYWNLVKALPADQLVKKGYVKLYYAMFTKKPTSFVAKQEGPTYL